MIRPTGYSPPTLKGELATKTHTRLLVSDFALRAMLKERATIWSNVHASAKFNLRIDNMVHVSVWPSFY